MSTPIREKYADVIKEEVNVKEISGLDIDVKPIFKPLGNKLSAKFGKDTGNIIRFGKMGNIEKLGEGKVKVFDDKNNEWVLDSEDYEIAYEGLDGDNIAADGDVVTRLDLEITEELKKEGIAREISRFLNQMRKEADFSVDTKVKLTYETENKQIAEIIAKFENFLSNEALLSSIEEGSPDGNITSLFSLNEMSATFSMKK